jgi:hypothetical protein
MNVELVVANVVVAAQQFNPTVLNQLWLADNGIVDRDGFEPGCVFTDMVVNVKTKLFGLFVSPQQMQFVPIVSEANNEQLVVDTLGKLLQTIPQTPYTGVGLNFNWFVSDDDVVELSRDLFFRQNNPLYDAFDQATGRFGAYLSMDWAGGRLKLDIKPINAVRVDGEKRETVGRLQFAFNFHFDIDSGPNAADQVCGVLDQWTAAHGKAKRIMDLTRGQQ